MSEWEQKTIGLVLPGTVQTILDSVSNLTSTFLGITGTLKTSLEAVKVFLIDIPNPALVALKAVCDEILNLLADLRASGIYFLVVHPYQDGVGDYDKTLEVMTLTPSKLLSAIDSSFDDEGDLLRPVFSDSAEVGAYVFLVATPSLAVFSPMIEAFGKLFSLESLILLSEKLNALLDAQENQTSLDPAPASVLPDWEGRSMGQLFPPYGDALKKIEGFVKGVKASTEGASKAIDNMIEFLEGKIAEVSELEASITKLQEMLNLSIPQGGVYLLKIDLAVGGVKRIRQEIQNASGKPDDALQFSAAVVLLGGSASFNNLAVMLS